MAQCAYVNGKDTNRPRIVYIEIDHSRKQPNVDEFWLSIPDAIADDNDPQGLSHSQTESKKKVSNSQYRRADNIKKLSDNNCNSNGESVRQPIHRK